MSVEDTSGSSAGQSELSLTVSHEVQLDSVTLAFSEGEIQDPINETLPYPQALDTQSATLDPSQTLKVSPLMSRSLLSVHASSNTLLSAQNSSMKAILHTYSCNTYCHHTIEAVMPVVYSFTSACVLTLQRLSN